MTPERFRRIQEAVSESLWDPIIRVESSRATWSGGWQALHDFVVIHRPKVMTVTVTEWEDISGLLEEALEEIE